MLCQRLDIISKNLSKNPKLDMTTNSKVLLAIILLTEYGYMILNEKKSHTVTNSAQNGLDHSRFIQYYKMMHIDFVHWMILLHTFHSSKLKLYLKRILLQPVLSLGHFGTVRGHVTQTLNINYS